MLVAPFLSRKALALSRKQYFFLLTFFLLLDFKYPLGRLYSNYDSIIHFTVLYLFAGYLKLYGNPIKKIKAECLLLIAWNVVLFVFMLYNFHRGFGDLKNAGYNGLLLFISISLFLCVMEVKCFKSKSALIVSKIAPYCFGVYLIHDNVQVRHLLWEYVDCFNISSFYLLYVIIVSLVVFACGIVVDILRTKLFVLLKVDKLSKMISDRVPNI